MEIDISKIVAEEIATMEGGVIQDRIRENIRKSILSAIDDTFGSYSLRRLVSDKWKGQLPEIVDEIGLDGYNEFLAATVKELFVKSIKNDAKKKIGDAVADIFCKRYDKYKLSDIIKQWKDYVDPEDDDEKRERNEEHNGFTCDIRRELSISGYFEILNLYLDELGDHSYAKNKEKYEFVITFRRLANKSGDDAKIDDVYIYGSSITNNIREVTGSFRGLLANLYLNKTPIIVDVEDINPDDCFYDVEGD